MEKKGDFVAEFVIVGENLPSYEVKENVFRPKMLILNPDFILTR
jgi:hypothetical protein